jgi:hypothetical protein
MSARAADARRPCNKEEVAGRVPQVIVCNEAAREVTLFQSVGSKQLGRSFHFDKARRAAHGLAQLSAPACWRNTKRRFCAILKARCDCVRILYGVQGCWPQRFHQADASLAASTAADRAARRWQVFAPESGQEKLYTQAIAPIVEEVLEGFNCTIFACAALPLSLQRTCLVAQREGQGPLAPAWWLHAAGDRRRASALLPGLQGPVALLNRNQLHFNVGISLRCRPKKLVLLLLPAGTGRPGRARRTRWRCAPGEASRRSCATPPAHDCS